MLRLPRDFEHLGTCQSPPVQSQKKASSKLFVGNQAVLRLSRHCRTRAGGRMLEETLIRHWSWWMSL